MRHLDQVALIAPLRTKNLDALALMLGEILLAHSRILEFHRQKNLVGNEALALVELRQQRTHDLFVGKFQIRQRIGLVAGQLALAHQQHLDFDETALAVQAEDILVAAPVRHHALFLQGLLDRLDLVANPRRRLELQGVGLFRMRCFNSSISSCCRPSINSMVWRTCSR